jgi:hypothetical protein
MNYQAYLLSFSDQKSHVSWYMGYNMGNKLRELTKNIIRPRYLTSGVHAMPSRNQEEGWGRRSALKKVGILIFCAGVLVGFENFCGPESSIRAIVRHNTPSIFRSSKTSSRAAKGTSTKILSRQPARYVQKFEYVRDNPDTQVSRFFAALRTSDVNQMRTLLNTGWVRVDSAHYKGFTPLIIATWQGNFKIVKFLLQEEKADPNARDSYGHTALYYAAKANQPEIAKLLRAAGANTVT